MSTCSRTLPSHMLLPASFLHCSYLHNALIRNKNKTKTKPKQNVHGRRSPLQQLGLALRRCLRCTVTRHASAAALAAAAQRTHTTPAAALAAAARERVTCALRAACWLEPPLPALSTPPARPVTSHLTLQPSTHRTCKPEREFSSGKRRALERPLPLPPHRAVAPPAHTPRVTRQANAPQPPQSPASRTLPPAPAAARSSA